ncbi:MAG: hypothetical protein IJG68_00490 [Bacilli bacterium]|nr:hypothetical protein [Bacilli bacterium]
MMKELKKQIILIVIIISLFAFLYLNAKSTYTSYESTTQAKVQADIADIRLKINGYDIVGSGTLNDEILLDHFTWESTHTREGKISPGSTGTCDLELDPTGSEVAILFEFEFIGKDQDETKLLNFGSITSEYDIVQTGESTYTGIIPKDAIENGDTATITLEFYFDATEDIEGIEIDEHHYDDLFEINFHAQQYLGETIEPYTGE